MVLELLGTVPLSLMRIVNSNSIRFKSCALQLINQLHDESWNFIIVYRYS